MGFFSLDVVRRHQVKGNSALGLLCKARIVYRVDKVSLDDFKRALLVAVPLVGHLIFEPFFSRSEKMAEKVISSQSASSTAASEGTGEAEGASACKKPNLRVGEKPL